MNHQQLKKYIKEIIRSELNTINSSTSNDLNENMSSKLKSLALAGLLGIAPAMQAATKPTTKTSTKTSTKPVATTSSKSKTTTSKKSTEPLKLIPVTRKATPPVQSTISDKLMKDIEIVAATLIGEAGGEGEEGMQAVLNVIMNRANKNFNNAAKVCLRPWQFSVWNDQKNNISGYIKEKKKHPRWNTALKLIKLAIDNKLPDITRNANFYVNPKVEQPDWMFIYTPTKIIGKHHFYININSRTNKKEYIARFY